MFLLKLVGSVWLGHFLHWSELGKQPSAVHHRRHCQIVTGCRRQRKAVYGLKVVVPDHHQAGFQQARQVDRLHQHLLAWLKLHHHGTFLHRTCLLLWFDQTISVSTLDTLLLADCHLQPIVIYEIHIVNNIAQYFCLLHCSGSVI